MTQPPRRPVKPRRSARRSPAQKAGKVFGALALLTLTAASVYGGYLYLSTGWMPKYLPGILHPKTVTDVEHACSA